MEEFLEQQGIEGATVLEVGGGLGAIQIELLRRDVEHTVNLELSPAYGDQAKQLLREAGFEDRAERHLHDVAVDPHGIESADVVVLQQVVCCYPDHERLLDISAARQEPGRLQLLATECRLAPPGQRPEPRPQNAAQGFRALVRFPATMIAAVEGRGFEQAFAHTGLVLQVAGLTRSPA